MHDGAALPQFRRWLLDLNARLQPVYALIFLIGVGLQSRNLNWNPFRLNVRPGIKYRIVVSRDLWLSKPELFARQNETGA